MLFTGIDLSLRNTGLVTLDKDGNLKDFAIVSNKENEEALIDNNVKDIMSYLINSNTTHIAIEGLSFMSVSSSRDIISGNYWHLRCSIYSLNKNCSTNKFFLEVVPVSRWRKFVISKERAKELKATGEKKWQKKEVVRKLPLNIKEQFDLYIKGNKLKKDSIYDLTDAFWLSNYLRIQNEAIK